MNKVRINDLARELEMKAKPILDALTALGVSKDKPLTHSSSIDADEAEKVRGYFKAGGRSAASNRPAVDNKPKFDLSKVSKPGDALRAILERKQAEAAVKAAPPPRPAPLLLRIHRLPRLRRSLQLRPTPRQPPHQPYSQALQRRVASCRCLVSRQISLLPQPRQSPASHPLALSSLGHLLRLLLHKPQRPQPLTTAQSQ
jgi:hypothetical protein